MKIEIKDANLCLPLDSIVNSMTLDQKREMLSWLATDSEVMESVVSHIVGEDELSWSTGDSNRRCDILKRVEDSQLSSSTRFQWRPWDEIRQKIKDIRSTEHLYWVLYHKVSPDVSRAVFDELRKMGIESNYTTKQGDDDIAAIMDCIDLTFKSMVKTKAEGAQ